MANLFGQSQPTQQAAPPNQQLLQAIRQNPRAYVWQLKSNPAAFLRKFGYDIPDGISDPMQIIQRLYGAPPPGIMGRR